MKRVPFDFDFLLLPWYVYQLVPRETPLSRRYRGGCDGEGGKENEGVKVDQFKRCPGRT